MRYHEHKVEGNAQVLKGALPTKYIKQGGKETQNNAYRNLFVGVRKEVI